MHFNTSDFINILQDQKEKGIKNCYKCKYFTKTLNTIPKKEAVGLNFLTYLFRSLFTMFT